MKKLLFVLFTSYYSLLTSAQEAPSVITEQQLENLTDLEQAETEDDSYLQQLVQFKKNPIDLNMADATELKELRILTDMQIRNLISYRNIFGKLINIYELQAVPGWDLHTIRKVLPFIAISNSLSANEDFRKRLRQGEHTLIGRASQILEKPKAVNSSLISNYLGGRQRIFFRYIYQYKNLLQYGVLGDKDAGEQFFRGAQKQGFDFYSFHFFARKLGMVQSLAIGDFTVNLGQGLIQWQSFAFKKSADVLAIKRESAILRPYNSAGEFYFNRGAGLTIRKNKFEATAFASSRKLSANFAIDSLNNEDFVTSFLTSGYHRTATEVKDRNKLRQLSFGGNITYRGNMPAGQIGRWQLGLNWVQYNFSVPVHKRQQPYNEFALSGSHWSNYSIDYSFTGHNFHFFGEAAIGKNNKTAFINGLLMNVDPKIDLSFVHRTITKEYQAVNGNAFTENAYPGNETGWYAGISIRPGAGWRFDAYGDIFKFLWLKYLVDAPSHGRDFLAQLIYTPNKQVEIYTRFRNQSKQINQSESVSAGPASTTVTNYLVLIPKQNWRSQISYKINASITLRNRVELVWYDKEANKESGFFTFFDFNYKPLTKPYSVNLRLSYFETGGYNSRLYAYENDVLYSFSIPQFSGKGFRYFSNLSYDFNKRLAFWLRLSQTIHNNQIITDLNEIETVKQTQVTIQLLCSF